MDIKRLYLSLCVVLASCTVGPDYSVPEDVPVPQSYQHQVFDPSQNAEPNSVIVEDEPIDPHWWGKLNDPVLNKLIARLATENLDIQIATTRIEQSRAQRGITAADFYPQLNGDGSYTREKLSDKGVISLISGGASSGGANASASQGIPNPTSSPAFNIYQYGFDASWELDLWGRVRRGVEGADASVQASREARRGSEISAIAELVIDYVQLRQTQNDLAINKRIIDDTKKIVVLNQETAQAGLESEGDVSTVRAQQAAAEAQLPPLQSQLRSLMNAIALLIGLDPGALDEDLLAESAMPVLPSHIPVGIPSELIERRPDIRQSSAQLHAATADIGVAEAEFFPKITLTGNGMLQSLSFQDLNMWAARSYTFGPSISLPIFEGGRLKATLELSNAAQREAAIKYRKSILTAFHEVDNALTAFRSESLRKGSLDQRVAENGKILRLAKSRFKQGLGDDLSVLTEDQNVLMAQQQDIDSAAMTFVNMAQLYKALGGGWETDFPVERANE